jgi:hypothetical protein
MQASRAEAVDQPLVVQPYKGFESIIHFYVAKHGPEIKALMEAFGYSGAASAREVAKHIKNDHKFAEAFADMLEMVADSNGYNDYQGDDINYQYTGVQYEGHSDFDSWAAAKLEDPRYKGKVYDNASGFDASAIMNILGGVATGIGGAMGKNKGGGSPAPGAGGPGPKAPTGGFFEKYKMFIIGGGLLIVGIVAIVLLKKK